MCGGKHDETGLGFNGRVYIEVLVFCEFLEVLLLSLDTL